MRIVSLLPSLTELVAELGRRGRLVGVTHECDYPHGVESLPHLTRSLIPPDADSATIDALVAAQGASLYALDADLLDRLAPDLILTQAQCDVCAVNEARVRDVAAGLKSRPAVESVNPTTLDEVFAMFRRVGALIDANQEAENIIATFHATTEHADKFGNAHPKKRLLLLEWVDPPYSSGHWNPELISKAGGSEPLAVRGQRSGRVTWESIAEADPDIILVAACGFSIDRTIQDLKAIDAKHEWSSLRAVRTGQVAITDGSAYFSRPGPRLETSLRIAAHCLNRNHPEFQVESAWVRWLN